MSVFKDSQQFYECVGALMDRAKLDPNIGPKIAKSGAIIQFKYTEPDAMTTINAKARPTQPGAFIDVTHGPCSLVPDIVMSMKADVSHAFWHGKVNLPAAIARKQMVIEKGSLPKILKLVPAITPLFKVYSTLLKEKGYANLVMK
jgi:hypothetical protein